MSPLSSFPPAFFETLKKNARSKENQAVKQKLQFRLNKVYAEYKRRAMEFEEQGSIFVFIFHNLSITYSHFLSN